MKLLKVSAATMLMIVSTAAAHSAEYGVGAFLTSNSEVIVPIEVGGGNWIIQPSITHYDSESPIGDSGFTGFYVNTLKRLKEYERVSVYAGLQVGAGEGKSVNRVFDISTSTLQAYERKYRDVLVMPNVQATYAVSQNFGVGAQFGAGFWNTDYSYDAYSPTPASVPTQTSTSLRTMLFVRYMFR